MYTRWHGVLICQDALLNRSPFTMYCTARFVFVLFFDMHLVRCELQRTFTFFMSFAVFKVISLCWLTELCHKQWWNERTLRDHSRDRVSSRLWRIQENLKGEGATQVCTFSVPKKGKVEDFKIAKNTNFCLKFSIKRDPTPHNPIPSRSATASVLAFDPCS